MRPTSPVVGGGLALLGLAAAASALFIPLGPGGDWGARLFPLMAAGTMAFAGLAEARRTAERSLMPGAPVIPVVLLALLATLYVWLMGRVGFLISTAAIVPPTLWLFGIRRPLPLAIAALAVPLALHLAFFRALGVFPPSGQWFDLLDLSPVL
ncbi:MAG: tripartite tricarboxylate transporter TctB family protein [Tabrizicola sp.]|nr:tripartite tricarboxylate transporter TctB family protein [Tabrizicola sp.]